jgi:hypothetical protein
MLYAWNSEDFFAVHSRFQKRSNLYVNRARPTARGTLPDPRLTPDACALGRGRSREFADGAQTGGPAGCPGFQFGLPKAAARDLPNVMGTERARGAPEGDVIWTSGTGKIRSRD